MLGLNKWFVIFLFLSAIVWYGTGNGIVAGQIMASYIVVKIAWSFLTAK